MTKLSFSHLLQCFIFLGVVSVPCAPAATTPNGPSDPKAQKTLAEAQQKLDQKKRSEALELFKKADKQDGRHCMECARQVVSLAFDSGDYKLAAEYANEMLADAKTPIETASGHAYRGIAELKQGQLEHKLTLLTAADQDLQSALAIVPKSSSLVLSDGLALAGLSQDEAARARFQQFLKLVKPDSLEARRAARYSLDPALARQRLAPPFEVTTIDGRRVSFDDLQGKVVLIDFWATWCGPCREALPGIQHIAQKFAGQPLVVLSVSLDSDDAAWKKFVADHKMTWLQTRDGGWNGEMAQKFAVKAIPHTFTIDADGVLQEEHIGDAAIEGKIKKLIAQAQQMRPPAATDEAKLPASN